MKIYLVSLGAGLLAGLLYSLIGVRSPAPPLVALIGLSGILLGQQIIPMVTRLANPAELARFVWDEAKPALLGVPNSQEKEQS